MQLKNSSSCFHFPYRFIESWQKNHYLRHLWCFSLRVYSSFFVYYYKNFYKMRKNYRKVVNLYYTHIMKITIIRKIVSLFFILLNRASWWVLWLSKIDNIVKTWNIFLRCPSNSGDSWHKFPLKMLSVLLIGHLWHHRSKG